MARIVNKDEVLERMGEYHAQHYKAAGLLLTAHGGALGACVTIFSDPSKAAQTGSVGAFTLLFGIGLIASILYYASIFMTQAVVKNAIMSNEDPNDSPSKGFLMKLNVTSIVTALLTLIIGVVLIIIRIL